jgi:hypothetical protein
MDATFLGIWAHKSIMYHVATIRRSLNGLLERVGSHLTWVSSDRSLDRHAAPAAHEEGATLLVVVKRMTRSARTLSYCMMVELLMAGCVLLLFSAHVLAGTLALWSLSSKPWKKGIRRPWLPSFPWRAAAVLGAAVSVLRAITFYFVAVF